MRWEVILLLTPFPRVANSSSLPLEISISSMTKDAYRADKARKKIFKMAMFQGAYIIVSGNSSTKASQIDPLLFFVALTICPTYNRHVKTNIYTFILPFCCSLLFASEENLGETATVAAASAPPLQEEELAATRGADPASLVPALRIIKLAISYGAPIYNQGNHMSCAAIYEVTVESLVSLGSGISKEAKDHLRKALLRIQLEGSVTDRAWVLRRGLDAAAGVIARQIKSGPVQFDSR